MKISLIKYTGFALVVLSLMVGCKSKQTLGGDTKFEKNKSHSQIVEDILDTQVKYNTISAKGNIEFKTGDSGKKVPAVYKILKDSILQVSVRAPMLGFEVFRVNITPDSVVIIDRLKKKYAADRISMLWAIAGLNFYNLQGLLTNQLFYPGEKSIGKEAYAKYNITSADDIYMLEAKGGNTKTMFDFTVDATNHIKSTLIRNEGMKIAIEWTYSDFIVDNKNVYPTLLSAKIKVPKAEKDINLNISFSKLDIDNPNKLEIDMSLPNNYDKVLLGDIFSAYMKKK